MSINATTLNLSGPIAPRQRPQLKAPDQAQEWKDFANATVNTTARSAATAASTAANTAASTAASTAGAGLTDTASGLRASLASLLLQLQEGRVR